MVESATRQQVMADHERGVIDKGVRMAGKDINVERGRRIEKTRERRKKLGNPRWHWDHPLNDLTTDFCGANRRVFLSVQRVKSAVGEEPSIASFSSPVPVIDRPVFGPLASRTRHFGYTGPLGSPKRGPEAHLRAS